MSCGKHAHVHHKLRAEVTEMNVSAACSYILYASNFTFYFLGKHAAATWCTRKFLVALGWKARRKLVRDTER